MLLVLILLRLLWLLMHMMVGLLLTQLCQSVRRRSLFLRGAA